MATYLGEKLHTNVQLPAILPGARGAALLWQGAAAATGLVLGAGQVYGGAAPFGLAFTMVCPPLYLFAAAGGVLISSLAFQPAVLGVKVIAALTATVAVRRLLQDKPNTKNAGIWAGCLALALVQAAVLFFAGGYVDLSQAAATGTTALLAAGSAWLMRRFPYREPRGLCLWLAIAAACLQRCARGPLAPGLAVAAAAGLCAAFAGTLEETAVVSITLAAAITAASPNLCYAALAVALGSLAAACLYPGERLRCAGVFAAGCVLGALAAPDAAGVLPLFVAGAVGLGAALAVPGAWLRVVFPPPAPPVQTQGLSGAARRLAGVADTLSDIADTVNAVCTRQMPPKGENFDFVVEHIARTTCQTCTRRSRCWVRGYATAMDGLYQLKPTLESRGRVEVEDLPGQLSVCIHPADLCTAANHGYRLWRSRRQTRARASMLRTALTEQYSAMAGALAQLAGKLGQAGLPDPRREEKVAQLFAGLGLDALECSVTSDLAGRLTAAVTIARTRFTEEEIKALTAEVSRICRRDMDLPEVTHCRTVTMLTFGERPLFTATFGTAGRPAKGQNVSGDALDCFCDTSGRAPTAAVRRHGHRPRRRRGRPDGRPPDGPAVAGRLCRRERCAAGQRGAGPKERRAGIRRHAGPADGGSLHRPGGVVQGWGRAQLFGAGRPAPHAGGRQPAHGRVGKSRGPQHHLCAGQRGLGGAGQRRCADRWYRMADAAIAALRPPGPHPAAGRRNHSRCRRPTGRGKTG